MSKQVKTAYRYRFVYNKIREDKFKDLNITINIDDKTVGTTVSACGGDVRPEKQKKINSSASSASSENKAAVYFKVVVFQEILFRFR